MKANQKTDNTRLQNYMALIFIAPPILSIMAYEFVDYMVYLFQPWRNDYNPLNALGMLIPMALMMQAFSAIFSTVLLKKVGKLSDFIGKLAKGDFSARISTKRMAPFTEVAEELNEMAEELGSVEVLRTNFINDFSHEFKTPIVSINGFANLLLDTDVSPEEQKEYLQIIAEESDRLSHMAKQTMLLSSLDSQTRVLNSKEYALDEQIRQDIILLSGEWSAKNLEMDIEMAPAVIENDPQLITHIWVNLLNNAIKFTPEGGRISVRLLDEGEQVKVQIADTGKGMTAEECRNIFNRYYQADASHSTKGLGLGLSITKRVVDMAQGQVSVQSEPGVGSTFTVTLPKRQTAGGS